MEPIDVQSTVCTPTDDHVVAAGSGPMGASVWRMTRPAALALIACLAMAVSETLGSPSDDDAN